MEIENRDGAFIIVQLPPQDRHCLDCGEDVHNDEIPYYQPCPDNGTEYVLCFDHSSVEWQESVIEFEQGIAEEDRYLPGFLLT